MKRSTTRRYLGSATLLGALIAPAITWAPPALAAPTAVTPATSAALPDPTARGTEHIATIQETKLGLVALQEPNSSGAPATPGTAQAAEELEVRGALYYPDQRTEKSPVLVLVHGNHGSCDAGQNSTTASCTAFKRNEAGYAYLGENLASWGYTVFSLSQDQEMMRQDNNKGKGMHQRRLLIAAALDALGTANTTGLTNDAHTTLGDTLKGKLDMTRIGLMGHSRGGDVVSSYVDYNRTRTNGPRYNLRGVIALAPVDYERKAPTGVPYMTILPTCDGDVSNMQGARMFERAQYLDGDDQFPKIQVTHAGGIHNWYNTVWYADGGADGQASNDAACGNSAPFASNNVHPHNLRLSGAASYTDDSKNYKLDNSDTYNPEVNTKISGDVERMGDQETLGLATMAAFFRRYVGGEGAFDPYMTGELSDSDTHLQVPASACPTSPSGRAIACSERVNTTYFSPAEDRIDVIRPEIENPLTLNALGGSLTSAGFATYDWCNPEPDDFAPAQLGKGTLPTAAKACPLPAETALGGQNATRENSPINHSYGRQLTLEWEKDQAAQLTAQIPAASKDVSATKALVLDADVNFWDTRNPGADNRGDNTRVTTGTVDGTVCTTALPCWPNEKPVSYDPAASTQDFLIKVSDTVGRVATVHAGDERWGNALHASTGTNTPTTHVILEQIRVPLSELTAQGVNVASLSQVRFEFGTEGTPTSGSIQVSDVRFQESATQASDILSDGATKADGAGSGEGSTVNPITRINAFDVSKGNMKLIDQVGHPFTNTSWVVDDDKVQCPTASFTSIQKAIDFAAPWDTIVVCDGTYEESSTPINHASNPVATGATNGLTITKPLKIKGAGADKVTIKPDQTLDTLAGLKPYLRDGGGNIITVSRQSLGSTDTNELFVDISGVTVTGGSTFAEAGIAFFGAAGRVSESVVGPFKVATSADELAENPHGYGIVKTSLIKGAGAGTVENEVTVANSVVKGYQSAGVLFDGGSGKDKAAANSERTGTIQHGYVTKSVITGSKSKLFGQAGVVFTNGVDGFVNDSRISGNYNAADPTTSFGVLLADAGIEKGGLTAARNAITGNGYAVFNAQADRTTVRTDARFTITGSYFGGSAPVAGAVADPEAGTEGISGSSSVSASSNASGVLGTVPTTYAAILDKAPTAELVSPADGVEVKVGETVLPIARGRDDIAVASAALLIDGKSVATTQESPYSFAFVPGSEYAGTSVKLATVITDSAGAQTTSAAVTVKVAKTPVAGGVKVPTTVAPLKPTIKVTKVVKQAKKGTAKVAVAVNGRGTIVLKGAKVRTITTAVTSTATVPVTLKASARKKLAKKGKVAVKITLTFTSSTGGKATAVKTITVVKKR